MTPERWQKIDQLLDEALNFEPHKRGAFLDVACIDDAQLRREVESLLASSEQAGDFIEPPLLSSDETTDNDSADLAGQALGSYRLLREIGRGGMGVVYLAVRADDEFKKQVAIKVVQAGPHNKDLQRRFRRERQILANLNHPNIAQLMDGGTTRQGVPYIVMEFVEGVPITEYCDAGKLSITERLKLFRIVCAAVQYAHQSLVIHRDLKPGNILVTVDGEVKLLDFGIAKLLDADTGPRNSKITSGLHVMTPEYASPEQIQAEMVTTASDVYSLGVVLYELLTGHYPYRFKDRSLSEIMRVICEQEPEPPSRAISRVEIRAEANGKTQTTISPESVSRTREGKPEKLRARLRGDLNDIALMALRKDPQRRYRTVEQLSDDIRRHLEGRPVAARKATLVYRASKFIRRYKTGAAVAAIIMLTLLGGILATLRQASIARQEARDKRRFLYAAQMNMAEQAWETTNIGRLRELVENQLPRDGEEDLRGFEWRYLWRLYHHNGERFTLQHDIEVWAIAFSPDGKLLATGDDAGLLRLWDTVTGQQIAEMREHKKFIWHVAFSPDGKVLATASGDRTAKLWETATQKEISTLRGHTQRVNAVEFSPDGKRVASSADDSTARVWDVASGRELIKIQVEADRVRALAFSPDGKTLAIGAVNVTLWDSITGKKLPFSNNITSSNMSLKFSPDGKQLAVMLGRIVSLLDASTGKEIRVFKGHSSQVRSVAFSPDGKMLATGSKDRTVKVWDIASGAEMKTIKGHEGEIFSVAFSPDGKTLATGSNDFTARLWDIAAASEFTYIENKDYRLAVSPDSRRPVIAAYGSLSVKLLDADSGQQLATFEGHSYGVISATFSPDGKILATGDAQGIVKLWDVGSQKEIASIKAHLDHVSSMMFSPDGLTLATASRDYTTKLWDVATGQQIFALTLNEKLSAVAFSPDGKTLATGSYDKMARLWDAKTGRELATLGGHLKAVLSLAFSPDGKTLATGSADSTVKIWDPVTGLEKATFTGHAGHVSSMAFSPDGKRLATGGDEGMVRLWDAATGQEVIALPGHMDSVNSVVFYPDGDTLVSSGRDGKIWFWRAAPREVALPQR
jgi:eukaryotic-like serine/threonine-protein kinase